MTKSTKYADCAESWYKVWCPFCDISNWYCNGNESDLSGLDVEAIKCRHCNKVFLLGPPDAILEEIRGNNYNYVTEDGIKLIKVDNKVGTKNDDE